MQVEDKSIIDRTFNFRRLSDSLKGILKELHTIKSNVFDPNSEKDLYTFREVYASVIQNLAEMRMNHRELYIVIAL